jgi:hypothetical protein
MMAVGNVMNRRTLLVLLAATPVALFSKAAPWKEGHLVAIDVKDLGVGKKLVHRYVCTVSDGQFNYTVEYEKPLKLAVNDPVKFDTKKDTLTLVDADGKKRSTKVEKRERIPEQAVRTAP